MIIKILWGVRAILYKLFFKRFLFPSYIGEPIFILGARKILIERKVRIFPGSRMEVHGKGKILIKEDVSIGQNVHITSAEENLVIGKKTTI